MCIFIFLEISRKMLKVPAGFPKPAQGAKAARENRLPIFFDKPAGMWDT